MKSSNTCILYTFFFRSRNRFCESSFKGNQVLPVYRAVFTQAFPLHSFVFCNQACCTSKHFLWITTTQWTSSAVSTGIDNRCIHPFFTGTFRNSGTGRPCTDDNNIKFFFHIMTSYLLISLYIRG